MIRRQTKILAMVTLLLMLITPLASAASVSARQESIREMANETLDRLYKVHPAAKAAVEGAVGYAVFSNYGVKMFVLGGGRGKGIAINNQSGHEMFMKKADFGLGLGLGVKDYSEVFVFETRSAFNKFIRQGWQFGAQTTLAATDGVSGGAYQGALRIWPGAWLYQMTDKGLAVEITGEGQRYYKDNELN